MQMAAVGVRGRGSLGNRDMEIVLSVSLVNVRGMSFDFVK